MVPHQIPAILPIRALVEKGPRHLFRKRRRTAQHLPAQRGSGEKVQYLFHEGRVHPAPRPEDEVPFPLLQIFRLIQAVPDVAQ